MFSFYAGVGDELTVSSSSLLMLVPDIKKHKKQKSGRKWVFAAEVGAVSVWMGKLARAQQLAFESLHKTMATAVDQTKSDEQMISGWLYKRNSGGFWKKRFFQQV